MHAYANPEDRNNELKKELMDLVLPDSTKKIVPLPLSVGPVSPRFPMETRLDFRVVP